MKLTAVLLFSLVVALVADEPVPAELSAAKARYDAALIATNTPAFERYVAEVKQLKTQAVVAKKVEQALVFDRELKKPNVDPVTDPGLVAARSHYETNLRASTKPLRERYLAELNQLKVQALKADKLELSLVFKKEEDRILLEDMMGRWADVHGVITINPDGTCVHSNGPTGTWAVENAVLVLKWSNLVKHTFPIVKTGDKILGSYIDPKGGVKAFAGPRVR